MSDLNGSGRKRKRQDAATTINGPIPAVHPQLGPYRILYRDRRTLGISVEPSGALEVAAPFGASIEEIQAGMNRRRRWVRNQRRRFAELNTTPIPKRYISGATHRYLGRQYRLKVVQGKASAVRLLGGYFVVETQDSSETAVMRLLDEWYRARGLALFGARLKSWEKWCAKHGLPKPKAFLRAMSKRWASAHKDGKIFFNPILARAPSRCIDYIVAHEVCHLKHHSHQKEFYRLLSRLFPDWRAVKLRLESCEF